MDSADKYSELHTKPSDKASLTDGNVINRLNNLTQQELAKELEVPYAEWVKLTQPERKGFIQEYLNQYAPVC